MQFFEFLQYLKEKEKLKSGTALYTHLGKDKVLKIGLRNFLQFYSGERHPSFEVFTRFINILPSEEIKTALQSYLKGCSGESKGTKKLLDYIEENLSIKVDRKSPEVWTKLKKVRFLSEKELIFLIENPEALRLLDLLILRENFSLKYFPHKKNVLLKMQEIGLIEISKTGLIKCPYEALRVPSPVNSPSPVASKGIQFIISKINNYFSSENLPSQKISYTIQCIRKEHLPHVINQVESMERWIRGLAETDDHNENNIPLVFVGFARGLSWGDF